jgi:hypothetical protein
VCVQDNLLEGWLKRQKGVQWKKVAHNPKGSSPRQDGTPHQFSRHPQGYYRIFPNRLACYCSDKQGEIETSHVLFLQISRLRLLLPHTASAGGSPKQTSLSLASRFEITLLDDATEPIILMAPHQSIAQQWMAGIDAGCANLSSEASRRVGWVRRMGGRYGDPEESEESGWLELEEGRLRCYSHPPQPNGRQQPAVIRCIKPV